MGGGVQVAASYISESMKNDKTNLYRYLLSEIVYNNLPTSLQNDSRIKIFKYSPASIINRLQIKKIIQNEESLFEPDVAFTIFGPAYVSFKCPHLVGFADPWVTHASKLAMSILSFKARIKMRLLIKYKKSYLSANDYYWVEAPVAARGLKKILNINDERIKVFPNTYSRFFIGGKKEKNNIFFESIDVLTITSPYIHKNITIIPKLVKILSKKETELNYKFHVTLPETGKEVNLFWDQVKKYDVHKNIVNHGVIKISECVDLYNMSDIVFLPTLLETFSATYPEAMYMGKPIVTTNLDFAKDACGDAAIYFKPKSASDAAEKLYLVSKNKKLYNKLINNGFKQLESLPDPNQKYQMLSDWIKKINSMNSTIESL